MKATAFAVCAFATWVAATSVQAAGTVRSQAVIDLTFDEPKGDALDSASAGKHSDRGQFVNGARRVSSPFWNQRGKRAAIFNARRKQYIRLPDSHDTDRPGGCTVSLFFLNLHAAGDRAARGIFGKRIDGGKKTSTNFGINYIGRADSLRPYINDGSGFRFPDFSLKQVAGSRRLVYLTATFDVADAPADVDPDTEKDDVLMRLFVNGRQVKPKSGVNTVIRGRDAWATNVNVKKLLNDVPLTLGSTNEKIEHASCLIDEFTLFDRALSPKEVAALFREVAGPHADKLAAEELKPLQEPAPKILSLSLNGLQIGRTTRLVIRGQNLNRRPVVRLPLKQVKARIGKGSNAGRVVVDLSVPDDAPTGFFPLRVQTDDGLSNAVVVAFDRLQQRPAEGTSAENPARLPAAFSGTVSGAQRRQVYFRGRAGDHIVAEVESRRLGATMDPVLEIKNARGTPLKIAWGHVALKEDTRAETTLPADGIYYVELHDLAFRAPGQSAFRLKVGDLKLVDAWFPPAVPRGSSVALRPIGTGFRPGDRVSVSTKGLKSDRLSLTAKSSPSPGPVPRLLLSDAREFVEPQSPDHKPPTSGNLVDARFGSTRQESLFINGIISQAGQTDRYRLDVDPGKKLRLQLFGRAIGSPIDAEITVRALPQKNVLARADDTAGSRDPALNVAVPGNAKQIEVAVRDLEGRGGSHFLYRLRVALADSPDFSLAVTAAQLNVPAGGSGFLQLQVKRAGYNGPIRLQIEGRDDLAVLPTTIPAGRGGRVFVTVKHRGKDAAGEFQHVRLVGSTIGAKAHGLRRTARVANASLTVPGWETDLPMSIGTSAPFSVRVAGTPPALFKGGLARVATKLKRTKELSGYAVRLSLVSTESPRRVDPRRPKLGNKPLVRAFPGANIPPDADSGPVVAVVPLDVAEREIEFVVKADLAPHAYSPRVIATAYSQPFRLPVKNALALTIDDKSLKLTGGRSGAVRGTVKRTAGFNAPVVLRVEGLPRGYKTQPVTLKKRQTSFAIPVTPAKEAKLRTLPKVSLRVTLSGKRPLLPPRTLTVSVSPPPKGAGKKAKNNAAKK